MIVVQHGEKVPAPVIRAERSRPSPDGHGRQVAADELRLRAIRVGEPGEAVAADTAPIAAVFGVPVQVDARFRERMS